jgi:hypothetical protein
MLPLLKDKTPILIVTKPKGIIPSQINFFFSLGIIMHLFIPSYSLFSCESINLHLCIICECMTFWFLLNWNFQFLSSYRFQLFHFFIMQKNCQIQEEIHVSRSFFYNIVHDYGNMCGIAYLFMDQDNITSGSGWLRHENSIESSPIKIGAPVVGKNETLFYCEALLELKKCIFESTMLWILV